MSWDHIESALILIHRLTSYVEVFSTTAYHSDLSVAFWRGRVDECDQEGH